METFAYTMAGIMILTVLVGWICNIRYRKAVEVLDFGKLDEIVMYSIIIGICKHLVVIEIGFLFVSAVLCGAAKVLA